MEENERPQYVEKVGRFPPNIVLTHSPDCVDGECVTGCPVRLMDEQSGPRQGRKPSPMRRGSTTGTSIGGHGRYGTAEPQEVSVVGYGDVDGASRFFPIFSYDSEIDVPFMYHAKASKKERNAGCEKLPLRIGGCLEGNADTDNARKIGARPDVPVEPKQNHHPTVKPVALIRWLQRLVTPVDGITGDPFIGSGTSGVAAVHEGFSLWGIDLDENNEYLPIANARIEHAKGTKVA